MRTLGALALALCTLRPALCAGRDPRPVVGTPAALAARLEAASRRHLGAKYCLDPLGEGPGGTIDRDPLSSWAGVDCLTYVEQCLAEALAPDAGAVAATLQRIRYRGGEVRFEARNHETVADWLPNNRWCARDITRAVGGDACRVMTKTWDRAAFFRRRGGAPAAGGAPQTLKTDYLPRESLPALTSRIPTGSMAIFVQSRPGIFAAHVGFLFTGSDGVRRLRHASQRRGRVVEEPLVTFLAHAGREVVGLKIVAFQLPK
jgi:hypothetical protein